MTSRKAVAATAAFNRALITIASQGLRPHCSDPGTSELWVSDHEGERAEAARLCLGCPVVVQCGEAADVRDEKWHVWGAKDYSRRPKQQAA